MFYRCIRIFLQRFNFSAKSDYGMRKLLISDIAKEKNVTQVTVLNWIKNGLLPGAKLNDSGIVPFWEIPETALKKFKKPSRGRPAREKVKGELAA